ncbi:MAG: hypothetical protein LBQ70_05835, partial [Prevotellaceae bacterium]|nr:hypothetical protein [Prevotellaceae bacterium]
KKYNRIFKKQAGYGQIDAPCRSFVFVEINPKIRQNLIFVPTCPAWEIASGLFLSVAMTDGAVL